MVALFTRAWIEIDTNYTIDIGTKVALFTRAWIEISALINRIAEVKGRPLHEGVD